MSKNIATAWEILQSIKFKTAKGVRVENRREIIDISC